MKNFAYHKSKFGCVYLLTPTGITEKAVTTQRFLQCKLDEYEALKVEVEALRSDVKKSGGEETQKHDQHYPNHLLRWFGRTPMALFRADFPKQFLSLSGNESLFQQAAELLVNLGADDIKVSKSYLGVDDTVHFEVPFILNDNHGRANS